MRKIFIAQPIAGGSRYDEITSLQDVIQESPALMDAFEFTFCGLGGGAVAIARNMITYQMITKTECEGMLTCDRDILATADNVSHILSHGQVIIGGAYPLKRIPSRWVYSPLHGKKPDRVTGRMQCKEVGTGFKYIPREVFERAIEKMPEIEYVDDHTPMRRTMWDFFCHKVINGRLLTEDYYFDHLAKKLGFKIYIDTKCQLGHMGPYCYDHRCIAPENVFPEPATPQFTMKKELFTDGLNPSAAAS